jgi:hypothetical protein
MELYERKKERNCLPFYFSKMAGWHELVSLLSCSVVKEESDNIHYSSRRNISTIGFVFVCV